jgi:hypothetical protein
MPKHFRDVAPEVTPVKFSKKPKLSLDHHFECKSWNAMLDDFKHKKHEPCSMTVEKIIREGYNPKEKITSIVLLIKDTFRKSALGIDVGVSFVDPTGEINGTIHRDVIREFNTVLEKGATLYLKHVLSSITQVSIFQPSFNNCYCNVTMTNIVKIYPKVGGPAISPMGINLTEKAGLSVDFAQTNTRDTMSNVPESRVMTEKEKSMASIARPETLVAIDKNKSAMPKTRPENHVVTEKNKIVKPITQPVSQVIAINVNNVVHAKHPEIITEMPSDLNDFLDSLGENFFDDLEG